MPELIRKQVRAIDDLERRLCIERGARRGRKTVVIRTYLSEREGFSNEIQVFEEELISALLELGVGTDQLYLDLVFRPDKRQELLAAAPVSALNLSIRTSNCLKAGQINTIGELVERSAEELRKIPAMGRKSISELTDIPEMLGFSLKHAEPVP